VINGIPTVLAALAVPFVLPNSPETASFLTEDDRRNLLLLSQAKIGQTASAQDLRKEDVMKGVKDWKVYAFALAQFLGLVILYSFSVFLPTILNGLGGGWNRQVVQALTIPVYLAGFVTYVVGAWLSDRTQQRGICCIAGLSVSMLGYIFLIANQGIGLSFAACFVVALGLWTATGAAFPGFLSITRATGSALLRQACRLPLAISLVLRRLSCTQVLRLRQGTVLRSGFWRWGLSSMWRCICTSRKLTRGSWRARRIRGWRGKAGRRLRRWERIIRSICIRFRGWASGFCRLL
jgi:hypothetical protein